MKIGQMLGFFLMAMILFSVACGGGGALTGEWERATQAIQIGRPDTRGMSPQEMNRALQENTDKLNEAGKVNNALRKWSYRIDFKTDGTALLYREGISGLEEVQYAVNGDRITLKSPLGNASYKFSRKGETLTFFDASSSPPMEVEYRRR